MSPFDGTFHRRGQGVPHVNPPQRCCSAILGPFVLAADLLLLLRREVVRDVECLANLLRRLALDHIGHGLAADIEKRLDVEVVRCLWSNVSNSEERIRVWTRRTRMISKSIS
jgi:hypothetical protein